MNYSIPSAEDMLKAGVHFGHRIYRWHPKMRPFIYGEKEGIHIINLAKTVDQVTKAVKFLTETVENGGEVLVVGTKRQAKDIVKDTAGEAGIPYVSNRWLGGLLTNFATIRKNLTAIRDLEEAKAAGYPNRTKKEALLLDQKLDNLLENFGGIRDLTAVPAALVVVDVHFDDIAVKEAKKLGIPVVGIVDTNADPDSVSIPVPANDDATTSLEMFTKLFVEVVSSAKKSAPKAEKPQAAAEAEKSEEVKEEA